MSNNTKNQNTQPQTETREPFRIEVEEHPDFPANTESFFTSSQRLCDRIANLFGAVFADLVGVKINVNAGQSFGYVSKTVPQGGLYVDLYFADRGNDGGEKVKNLIPLAGNPQVAGSTMAERYNRSLSPSARRMYELSQETKEALDEFLIKPNGRNLNWNEVTFEIPQQLSTISQREEAVVQVTGLNLTAIISKLYGAKLEDGLFQYTANWSQPNHFNTDFIVQVSRINVSTLNELSASVGVTPNPGINYYPYNG